MNHRERVISHILLVALLAAAPQLLASNALVATHPTASEISFAPGAQGVHSHGGATLTVTGPGDLLRSATFDAEEEIRFSIFDAQGSPLPNGSYTYEIRFLSDDAKALRSRLQQPELEESSASVPTMAAAFGSFSIEDGALVRDDRQEGSLEAEAGSASSSAGSSGLTNVSAADILFIDDVIISRNLCVGGSCINGETFGQDVIRLKDANNRIRFLDTSTGSFPTTDWQILANDSTAGGANRFSIEDVSATTVPFTIAAAAPNNALYVRSTGNVGFGTATPADKLHVVSGDTPALQLQQDGSSSFMPQSWRVAGNEAGFFVMDSTHGSILPFRIRPDAIENSLVIAPDGNVGLGTLGPISSLHVRREGVNVLVQDSTASEAARVLFTLRNNGRVLFEMDDLSADGQNWRFRTVEGQFQIDTDGSAGNELILTQAGNLTIQGMLTELSDRQAKTGITTVDPAEVLAKVAQLPIATWSYKKEEGVEHLGPMAQDFHALFGLGASNQGITTYDAAGAALASVQALHRTVQNQEERMRRKDDEIEELQRQNADLLRRLEALERNSTPIH